MRRVALLLGIPALLLAIALAGCGGGSDSGSALDDALGYLPKDTPFAVAIDTDVEGDQYQALGKLIRQFPFGQQALQSLQQQIESGDSNLDYEDDIKPLLGNPFVVGAPDASGFVEGGGENFIGAIQAKDGDKLEDVLKKSGAKEVGDKSGAKIYENSGSTFAIQDDVLVVADTRKSLEAAIDTHEGDDHFDEDTFNKALDGLPDKALARVYADVQGLLQADPDTKDAQKVEWVSALRTLGLTAVAESDSLAFEFNLKTEGDLSDEDLPIAAGDKTPQIVDKQGQINFGIRDPGQIIRFAEAAGQAVDPRGFGQYEAGKRQIEKRLGVSVDDDLIDQLSGNVSVNVAIDGTYGVRAELKDPAAFKRTLAKVADILPSVAEGAGAGITGLSKPKAGQDFYALAQRDGDSIVFGVVDDVFVLSNSPAAAGKLASDSPSDVPGTEGSVVMSADAEQVAKQALAQIGPQLGIGGALGGSLFTGPLGDLIGSVSASPDGLKGKVTLGID
jgi:Protein of unknown function (DUF3352)